MAPAATPVILPLEKPVWPEAANTHDEAGAIAFAKYYLELSKWTSNVGSGEEMMALSAPQCIICKEYVEDVAERIEAGGSFTGGKISFPNPDTEKSTPQGLGFLVELDAGEDPAAIRDKTESAIRFTKQSVITLVLGILPVEGGWRVTGIAGGKR